MIVFITLILEQHLVAQHGETVGHAFGQPQLPVVALAQPHSYPLSVGRIPFPYIYRHVYYLSDHTSYQLPLGKGRLLEM